MKIYRVNKTTSESIERAIKAKFESVDVRAIKEQGLKIVLPQAETRQLNHDKFPTAETTPMFPENRVRRQFTTSRLDPKKHTSLELRSHAATKIRAFEK